MDPMGSYRLIVPIWLFHTALVIFKNPPWLSTMPKKPHKPESSLESREERYIDKIASFTLEKEDSWFINHHHPRLQVNFDVMTSPCRRIFCHAVGSPCSLNVREKSPHIMNPPLVNWRAARQSVSNSLETNTSPENHWLVDMNFLSGAILCQF